VTHSRSGAARRCCFPCEGACCFAMSGRLPLASPDARFGRQSVVRAGAELAPALRGGASVSTHNAGSFHRAGVKDLFASRPLTTQPGRDSDFLATSWRPRAQDLACQSKISRCRVGLRNRRSEVRILSGALLGNGSSKPNLRAGTGTKSRYWVGTGGNENDRSRGLGGGSETDRKATALWSPVSEPVALSLWRQLRPGSSCAGTPCRAHRRGGTQDHLGRQARRPRAGHLRRDGRPRSAQAASGLRHLGETAMMPDA
jgi:hypothetical protein